MHSLLILPIVLRAEKVRWGSRTSVAPLNRLPLINTVEDLPTFRWTWKTPFLTSHLKMIRIQAVPSLVQARLLRCCYELPSNQRNGVAILRSVIILGPGLKSHGGIAMDFLFQAAALPFQKQTLGHPHVGQWHPILRHHYRMRCLQ